jgi:hypothetical protein
MTARSRAGGGVSGGIALSRDGGHLRLERQAEIDA